MLCQDSAELTSLVLGQHQAVLQGLACPKEKDPQAADGSASRSEEGPRSGGSLRPLLQTSSASIPVTALGVGSPHNSSPPSVATPHLQLRH